MNVLKTISVATGLLLLVAAGAVDCMAQDKVDVSLGADVVSRYVWRGLNVGDAPSVQPSIAAGYKGFELGTWGAYSLSNEATDGDEIDFWLGYTHEFASGAAIGLLVTDYYFPNAGEKFSNFQNYDDEDGAGAHTVEIGGSVTLPGSLPITLAGYINVYNDEGNNAYFQADCPVTAGETDLNFFVGVTPGSDKNPDYYGADEFKVLNVGVTASKEVQFSESFSLPISGSFIVNANLDMAYLVVGFSL